MEIAIKYTNNRGESIIFGGEETELHFFENSLRSAKWSYSIDNGRLNEFYKDTEELELKVGIAAESEDSGLELRERLISITERDIVDKKPGKITINGWNLDCYVFARDANNWWYSGKYFECTLSILVLAREWYKLNTYHFDNENYSQGDYEYLDFSYDYPHDYNSGSRKTSTINNTSLLQCDVIIRIYGPAHSPSIDIDNNRYGVNVNVPEFGILEINSEDKTVLLYDAYGNASNVFGKRLVGGKGSGSYIFETVKEGLSSVSSSNASSYDIVIKEKRSEPVWS